MHLFDAVHHAALQLVVAETVSFGGGLGLAHDGIRRQRRLATHPLPTRRRAGSGRIRQVGPAAIADIEQISQHLHRIALLTSAKQGANRQPHVLTYQIQQRCFDRGDDVVRTQVDLMRLAEHRGLGRRRHLVHDGLAPRRRARQRGTDGVADRVVVADWPANHKRDSAFQRLADPLAARDLGHTGVARAVLQHHDVASEERAVRPGQVQQHAVPAGNRDDQHLGDNRCAKAGGVGWCGHDLPILLKKLPALVSRGNATRRKPPCQTAVTLVLADPNTGPSLMTHRDHSKTPT